MNPDFLVIDLFCGAGGTTTGFERARIGRNKVAKVIACVNHDTFAIQSHSANHKSVLHFTEDIRTLDLGPLARHIERMKRRYPDAKLVLWASLECTNFSRAKGGQPRDADSRTLAEHLFRYFVLQFDYIMIENVEEFMCWGPLDETGRPISKHQGEDFTKWVNEVKSHRYNYEYRLLNAADYGAYTSRTRYFAIFARPELPIAWPEPTHAKNPTKGGLFRDGLRKWKPVKDCLDLKDIGRCIFERDKPLSEKTLQRIYAGLIKYVAGGKDAFMIKYFSSHSGKSVNAGADIEQPSPTITTFGTGPLVQTFLVQRNSGDPNSKVLSVDRPSRTITTTGGNLDLITAVPAFLMKYLSNPTGGVSQGSDLNNPSPTVTCQNRLASVFISAYHGNGHNMTSSDKPCPTIAAADSLAKTEVHWMDQQYGSGKDNHKSIEEPSGSILNNPKQNLATASFLFNHNYDNTGKSIDQPAPTLLASRKHYYLVNPSWGGNNGSIEDPCCTIVARQDKAPLYITTTEAGELAIQVYETDSEMTVKIKEFMAIYGIGKITMRMLKVDELKAIHGIPQYNLVGNQSKQKWMIGNMVVPVVPQHIARANSRALRKLEGRKAA